MQTAGPFIANAHPTEHDDLTIWAYAFGYFACYVPYSALTKALSQGHVGHMEQGISGLLATVIMGWLSGGAGLASSEIVGVFLVLGAIVALAWPTLAARFRRA